MYYFYLFSSIDVSYVLSISSSSSFDKQWKLEGGKCFLSMSTCWTLTLGCRCPIVNWPPKKFTVSAPYKRLSMRTCCRSTDETHHRIALEVSWQRVPLNLAGKVIPNLQCSKGNPKIYGKKKKENWAKQAREKEKLSFDFFGPASLTTIRLFDEYFKY